MANTEGMSDEAMASLLITDSALSGARKKSAFAERQARMRQRMEQPMSSGRPAATVIRPSPPVKKSNNDSGQRDCQESDDPTLSEDLPPILGSVIERDVSASDMRPKSHLVAQREKPVFDRNMGFPSVKMPIGTFVRDVHKRTTRPVQAQEKPSKPSDSIQDACQRDAEGMLAQMTPTEIHENIQDLQAALSPETLAFFKKRGQSRPKANEASEPISKRSTDKQSRKEEKGTERKPLEALDKIEDVEEKLRVSSLLSSIRTYEELDAAYAREIGINAQEEQETPIEDDWYTACNLLRSTSSRQTVWAARVVCQHLESDVMAGRLFSVGGHEPWPYPKVLVVSLRCLLDVPISQTNGLILHMYVLRSLYALLRLRVHADHVVDVSCSSETPASIYQEYFMNDAVPTPPFGTCYPSILAQPLASINDGDAIAYSTASSSTSVQQDGEAFAKDPLWTLLTRMRILPRLADLLSSSGDSINLPDESILAICGILSMLSMRSIGAASVISQHPVILSSLLRIAALPPTDEVDSQYSGCLNTRVALPVVIFMCTLARQSRMVAAALPIDSILPPVLALSVETEADHKLQKWSLILWRTMLRYGLGLSGLSTYVALSIPHLASARPPRHSLAAEFLSAFTVVCHCVRIAESKPASEWSRVMSSDEAEIVPTALNWLATIAGQTVHHLKSMARPSNEFNLLDMRMNAVRLRFLKFYIEALDQESTKAPEERKWDTSLLLDWDEVVGAMKNVLESGFVETALAMVPSVEFSRASLDLDEGWVEVISLRQEAVASAFIDALASLLPTLSRAIAESVQGSEEQTRDLAASHFSSFKTEFVDWINQATLTPTANAHVSIPTSQRGWLNMMNFHISRFLIPDMPPEFDAEKMDVATIRSHAFSLIGRLQRGEEALAAVLCKSDILFRTDFDTRSTVSPLSSFLLSELCSASLAQQQLDHSFKLYFGFGISPDGWGPFETGTLLSEDDSPATPVPTPVAELLLPMGPLWLPKILSVSMIESQPKESSIEHNFYGITGIVSAGLELLLYLEDEKVDVSASYARQLPNGAKLYYLMNVFLHPESVLRDDRINELASNLFDRLVLWDKGRPTGTVLAASFSQACFDHNQRVGHVPESEKIDPNDEKLFSMLLGDSEITTKEMRPLIDFVSDLADAYMEFGAQYQAFTKCIRVFLSFCFPSRIRCEAIRALRDVLHLLTLPSEEANPDGHELTDALNMCLFGDVVHMGEAVRDSPEVLDLIVSIIMDSGATQGSELRWSPSHGGFFFTFAIASLARGLVTSKQHGASSVEAMKRRLSSLSTETADIVFETAERLQTNTDGKSRDLVSTAMGVLSENIRVQQKI